MLSDSDPTPAVLSRRQLLGASAATAGLLLARPLGLLGADGGPADAPKKPTDEKETAMPKMHWADDSRGRPYSKDPSVIRLGEAYFMYFSLPPAEGKTAWNIGIAKSDDLLHWKTVAELNPGAEYEKNGLCAPGAIVLDGRVHLFYQTYGNGPRDAICHASSADAIHFERDPSSPVIRPTGDWNCGRAIDADAFVVGDQLFCYWATRDPDFKIQMIGVHSAPLDSDFSAKHWTQRCTGPILKPELPWEKQCIEAPTVCRAGQEGDYSYVMFYAGGYNNEPQQIGSAISRDGLKWERQSKQPLLPNGPAGSWNSSESGHPGIFIDADGTTWLFYQGNNDHGKSWYLSREKLAWDGPTPRLAKARG